MRINCDLVVAFFSMRNGDEVCDLYFGFLVSERCALSAFHR